MASPKLKIIVVVMQGDFTCKERCQESCWGERGGRRPFCAWAFSVGSIEPIESMAQRQDGKVGNMQGL